MRSLLLLAAETGETGGTGEEVAFWIFLTSLSDFTFFFQLI